MFTQLLAGTGEHNEGDQIVTLRPLVSQTASGEPTATTKPKQLPTDLKVMGVDKLCAEQMTAAVDVFTQAAALECSIIEGAWTVARQRPHFLLF